MNVSSIKFIDRQYAQKGLPKKAALPNPTLVEVLLKLLTPIN
ncbi:hypothetical protein [Neobacillus cucumis]|jgi:hypothetical protein|nr:hypothetical protein [Neobacillus cucumis]